MPVYSMQNLFHRRDIMINEYKYIENIEILEGGGIRCRLSHPVRCTTNYFIDAFWVPMKHQLGKKFVLLIKHHGSVFELWYNQLAVPQNIQHLPEDEFMAYVKHDAKEAAQKALRHIDRIIAHMYAADDYFGETIIPFANDVSPIKSLIEETITLNGRLPMQEEYFIKIYWRPLVSAYRKRYSGIQFELCFSTENGTMELTPSITLRRHNAAAAKHGVCNTFDANPILQQVTCDLEDIVQRAVSEYADSCK